MKKFIVALLCGGPSLERGISFNSARSLLDHISSDGINIVPIYFDLNRQAYKISPSQLYSNTPSDFDFKLRKTSEPLTRDGLVRVLKRVDIVFPAMHGAFGEDGEIQSFLEKNKIPFVGSGSASCRRAFNKYSASKILNKNGFYTIPILLVKKNDKGIRENIKDFFKKHDLTKAIVKPVSSGSSVGVSLVNSEKETILALKEIFTNRLDKSAVVEPFLDGAEFTVIVLQDRQGDPIALAPTEVEIHGEDGAIFDYRKKYLPTNQVKWHCPPRFSEAKAKEIRRQAERVFSVLEMRDFCRLDGWLMEDGKILFTDINTISGMEQNSFLFKQAARLGMTHRDILGYIIRNATSRYGKTFPIKKSPRKIRKINKKSVNILFGGSTSERQVSLMSGTNVWLKLRDSHKYSPRLYLFDGDNGVWSVPYDVALCHTTEDIMADCLEYKALHDKLSRIVGDLRERLGVKNNLNDKEFFVPKHTTLKKFINKSKFVFLGLHGGAGEDGTIQALLTKSSVKFNGPDERVSRLAMDKWDTKEFVKKANIEGVTSIAGSVINVEDFINKVKKDPETLYRELLRDLDARTLIVKPRSDGCSSGVVHVFGTQDLIKYANAVQNRAACIPAETFRNQSDIIEMPTETPAQLLIEKHVEVDELKVSGPKIVRKRKEGWIEMTVGVVQDGTSSRVFNPSITVAEGEVLSVEEKFQGGTGVNLTPPPEDIISKDIRRKIKRRIKMFVDKMKIQGYSRIDFFAHDRTGNVMIIEVNTLPGLTPSTVLYQQALVERPPIYPRELLELLISNKKY